MTTADLVRQLADFLAESVDESARGQKAKYLLDRIGMLRSRPDPAMQEALAGVDAAWRRLAEVAARAGR